MWWSGKRRSWLGFLIAWCEQFGLAQGLIAGEACECNVSYCCAVKALNLLDAAT